MWKTERSFDDKLCQLPKIRTKNYQNLINDFQVTVENVWDVFWDTVWLLNHLNPNIILRQASDEHKMWLLMDSGGNSKKVPKTAS